MKYRALEHIQWHDLPVDGISFGVDGVRMVVTPYEESAGAYAAVCLSLSSVEGLSISVVGTLSADDLSGLEVVSFEFRHVEPGQISGSIEILPGQAGLWRISFTRATWELCAPNNSLQARRP